MAKAHALMFTEEMPWLKGRDLELLDGTRARRLARLEAAAGNGSLATLHFAMREKKGSSKGRIRPPWHSKHCFCWAGSLLYLISAREGRKSPCRHNEPLTGARAKVIELPVSASAETRRCR